MPKKKDMDFQPSTFAGKSESGSHEQGLGSAEGETSDVVRELDEFKQVFQLFEQNLFLRIEQMELKNQKVFQGMQREVVEVKKKISSGPASEPGTPGRAKDRPLSVPVPFSLSVTAKDPQCGFDEGEPRASHSGTTFPRNIVLEKRVVWRAQLRAFYRWRGSVRAAKENASKKQLLASTESKSQSNRTLVNVGFTLFMLYDGIWRIIGADSIADKWLMVIALGATYFYLRVVAKVVGEKRTVPEAVYELKEWSGGRMSSAEQSRSKTRRPHQYSVRVLESPVECVLGESGTDRDTDDDSEEILVSAGISNANVTGRASSPALQNGSMANERTRVVVNEKELAVADTGTGSTESPQPRLSQGHDESTGSKKASVPLATENENGEPAALHISLEAVNAPRRNSENGHRDSNGDLYFDVECATPSREELVKLSPYLQEMWEVSRASVDQLCECSGLSGEGSWKHAKRTGTGIDVFTRNSPFAANLKQVVGKARCGVSVMKWLHAVTDQKNWKSWDPLVRHCSVTNIPGTSVHEELHGLSELSLVHLQMAGVFPMSGREMYYLQTCRELTDGSWVVCGRSVESDDVPEGKDFVRGFIHGSGWHIGVVPSRPDECDVTYIMNIDPRLKFVPSGVMNMAANQFPGVIDKVRKGLGIAK